VKCERVRHFVSDALDGVLGDHVADRFHRHLDDCPPCRAYYTELKESLLLLEELPVVDVDDSFDRAVWARIRREEEPVPLGTLLRERFEMLRVRFSFGTGLWRWAPAGVAALILLGVATSSGPARFGQPAPDAMAQFPEESDVDLASLEPGASAPRPDADALTTVDEDGVEVAFEEEEFPSEMPHAIEAFLQSGQDLRLKNTERYERSNYSYPLRRIQDPSRGQFVGQSVRGGQSGRTGTPVGATVPTQGSAGVTVLAF